MCPDIDIWTATISTSAAISGTKSPGGTMFTIGTLIMMRVPVSVESAVAACPAPMFATSRSASRRAVLSSVVPPSADCASRGIVMSEKSRCVDDEGWSAIAKNCGAAEKCPASVHTVELFDDDFLLSDELVHNQGGAPIGQFDQYHLADCLVGHRDADAVTQPDRLKDIVADGDYFLSFDFLQH